MKRPDSNSSRVSPLAAIKSGVRRYPVQIVSAMRRARTETSGGRIDPVFTDRSFAAVWLGHSTVLMRVGGITVLTDPVLSSKIGARFGPFVFGPHRLSPAPLEPEAIPPIDVLLLSHAHFDHLDLPTLERLASRSTLVVTAKAMRRLVPRGFGDVLELRWDTETVVRGVRIAALRPNHWGARKVIDRHRRYNAYLIGNAASRDVPGTPLPDHPVLFAGDTAYTSAFKGIGPTSLAVFGIGAYSPWIRQHANPEQVWQMFVEANASHLMPVHHSTYPLGDEPLHEPMDRLLTVAGDQAHRVLQLRPGHTWCGEGHPEPDAPGRT